MCLGIPPPLSIVHVKTWLKKQQQQQQKIFLLPSLSTMSSLSTTAIQSLDEASRKEIMQFVESEQSKSKVQLSIHNFTDMCFKKCNKDKPITSATLDGQEEACLKNCLNRFLDTNIKVVEALQGR